MTSGHSHGYPHEHELEPQRGLPEALPSNERIVWQGSPSWVSLARHAFHVRKLVVYFAVIIAIRMANVLAEGGGLSKALVSALWLSLLAAVAIGILTAVAFLVARTTIYTITNRRVVMRIGIVLRVTFNLPFKRIASADLKKLSNNTGDIPLALMPEDQIAYLHLWPHARPWRFAKTEPMLRSVRNPEQVAATLTKAWSACVGGQAMVSPTIASTAEVRPEQVPSRASHADRVDGQSGDMRTA
ncbi:MAG: PH domain-containing protein [Burkholderiaceae bacterium]|nr:PH domain-containing protein [Burkholderiaceae bacterium]